MDLPDEYLAALTDELAPFGFEFGAAQRDSDGGWQIRFDAEPESFVHSYPWTEIDASYGDDWPPLELQLWIRIESDDVVEISFEVYDVLLWAQDAAPDLAGRLATLAEPGDQAAAVGQAMGDLLEQPAAVESYDNLG